MVNGYIGLRAEQDACFRVLLEDLQDNLGNNSSFAGAWRPLNKEHLIAGYCPANS